VLLDAVLLVTTTPEFTPQLSLPEQNILVFTELLGIGQHTASLANEHADFNGVTDALDVRNVRRFHMILFSLHVKGQHCQMGSLGDPVPYLDGLRQEPYSNSNPRGNPHASASPLIALTCI
jgi:hypothetical protein